jgi:sugar phosphate isomerase/epimerase
MKTPITPRRIPGFHWLSAMWQPTIGELGHYAAMITRHGGKLLEIVPPGLNPFSAKELAWTLKGNGIRDVAFTCFFPSDESAGNPIGNKGSYDQALETVAGQAIYMRQLIEEGMTVHAYTGPSGWALGHGRSTFPLEQLCDYYREVLRIFDINQLDVPIAIEFLRRFEDSVMGPDNLDALLTELHIKHGVAENRIGAHLDWYHCDERCLDPVDVIERFGPRIKYVHAHGSKRLRPGVFQDKLRDTVHHEHIVQALNNAKYTSPIVFEQFCELVPNELREGLLAAERTETFVQGCMQAGYRYGYFPRPA